MTVYYIVDQINSQIKPFASYCIDCCADKLSMVFKMKSGSYDEKSPDNDKESQEVIAYARMISFRDRLKEAIGDETVRGFSRKCGLSEATLRDYLKGASYPTLDRLNKIAITAARSMGWLVGDEFAVAETLAKDICSDEFLNKFALIPGYGGQVSAGSGSLPQGERACSHLAFRRQWLESRGFAEKELAIVWSKGDSMEPTIGHNDTLVVHLARTHPVDGHIYVVRNDEQLWVKRLQVRPSAWLLLSDNPFYPPIEVPKDQQDTFDVIGQVVHISHDVGE